MLMTIRKNLFFLSLFFILVLLFTGCGGKRPKITLQLTINVKDAISGKNIIGANVALSSGQSGTTDSSGTVKFAVEGKKSYTVVVKATEYNPETYTVKVEASNMTYNASLSKQEGSICGFVLDQNNVPLEGAQVSLNDGYRTANTDINGYFILESVPISSQGYTLQVTKDGFGSRTLYNIKLSVEKLTHDAGKIVLSNIPGIIKGIVTSQAGSPLSNIRIFVKEANKTAYTNTSGDYSIEVFPGNYILEFSHQDYATHTQDGIEVQSSKEITINVTMAPKPGILSGTVKDSFYQPVRDITVTILGIAMSGKTDSSGYFRIENIPPGNYQVEFSSQFYIVDQRTVIITSGKEATINNVELKPKTGILRGQILDANTKVGISGAVIRSNVTTDSTTSMSDGTYEFSNIRIGEHSFIITATDYSTGRLEGINVLENKTIEAPNVMLYKHPGSISGTVRDAITNKYLEKVKVTVVEDSSNSTQTDSLGVFNIRDLPPSTYSLKFDYDNYETKIVSDIDVSSMLNTSLGTIDLQPKSASIEGTTTPGATVELRSTSYSTVANGVGFFIIELINPGEYTVDISKAGYDPKSIPITLKPGKLLNMGDQILIANPGKIVGLTNAESVTILETGQVINVVNESFSIDLLPGNYVLEFNRHNYISKNINVTVYPSETSNIGEITLIAANGYISGYTSSGGNLTIIEARKTETFNGPAYFNIEIAPGTYNINLQKPGYQTSFYKVTVNPGQTANLGDISTGASLYNDPYATRTETVSLNDRHSISISPYLKFNQTFTVECNIGSSSNTGYEKTFYKAYIYKNSDKIVTLQNSWSPCNPIFYNPGDTYTAAYFRCRQNSYSGDYSERSAETNWKITYQKDLGKPTYTLSKYCGYDSSFNFQIYAEDILSGISSIQYSLNKSSTSPGSYTSGSTISLNSPGIWYLHIKLTDKEGNITTAVEGPYIVY